MAHPSLLAQYIADRLAQRHESADEFARRIDVNASGLYKLLRGAYGAPHQRTLDKIAMGLGMSPSQLLAAAGEVLATYVHLAQTAIAQRAGRVAPTGAWLYERDA